MSLCSDSDCLSLTRIRQDGQSVLTTIVKISADAIYYTKYLTPGILSIWLQIEPIQVEIKITSTCVCTVSRYNIR